MKALIAGLQSKSEANTRRLVSALEDAARLTVHNQEDALGSVAGLWAEAGGLPAAMRIVDRIQSTHSKSWALLTIVEAQLKLGDVAGAVRSAEPMQDTFYKSVALKEIAEVQAEAGEIETALETASAIQHPVYKGRALIAIARAQAASNDLSDARNTIRAASLAESNDGGTPTDASDIASIEAEITRASKATPTATSPVRVRNVAPAIQRSDWTERLDDSWIAHDGALNTAPFLNMAAYLDDQHAQTPNLWSEREQDWLFSNLLDKAKKIVAAQIVIEKMVKQQTKLEAYP